MQKQVAQQLQRGKELCLCTIASLLLSSQGQHVGFEISSTGAQFDLETKASTWAYGNPDVEWRPLHTHDAQRRYVHHISLTDAYNIVENDLDWLSMTKMGKARTIEIDFTSAYCPLACCRLLFDYFWVYILSRMEKVRMLCLLDEPEEDEFIETWATDLSMAVAAECGSEQQLSFYKKIYSRGASQATRDKVWNGRRSMGRA